jgi:hypothetical protein
MLNKFLPPRIDNSYSGHRLALWLSGLYRLIIYSLCVLVLVRYRSGIPFMFALLALEFLAAQLILHFIPLVRTGTPPAPFVNRILFALMIVGLVLSLWNRVDTAAELRS